MTPPSSSLPPTPTTSSSSSKANVEKNHRKKSTKQHQQQQQQPTPPATTTKMQQWHDTASSYRCFETIATPSPIPIAKSNQNQSLHAVHRSTSLDSLANSETNHSDSSSQSSWCNTDPEADSECLSNCDSITDPKESTPHENLYETYCNNNIAETVPSKSENHEKPIITELVKKKKIILPDKFTLCENRDCAYRQFEQHHSINDCAPNTDTASANGTSDETIKSKDSAPNAPFVLNNNSNSNKTRRTSVASSGSVSRMETIVEEPIEPKISVKEILARFETLTSLEVCLTYSSKYFNFLWVFWAKGVLNARHRISFFSTSEPHKFKKRHWCEWWFT